VWESFDLGPEDVLWAAVPFMGGIAGNQEAPCGAVSAAVVAAGLIHRAPLADKGRAREGRGKARSAADRIVKSFVGRFGALSCRDLVGMDFSSPGEYAKFLESGLWKEKCNRYVEFLVGAFRESADVAPRSGGGT
jgi:hypothetical protein